MCRCGTWPGRGLGDQVCKAALVPPVIYFWTGLSSARVQSFPDWSWSWSIPGKTDGPAPLFSLFFQHTYAHFGPCPEPWSILSLPLWLEANEGKGQEWRHVLIQNTYTSHFPGVSPSCSHFLFFSQCLVLKGRRKTKQCKRSYGGIVVSHAHFNVSSFFNVRCTVLSGILYDQKCYNTWST